MRTKINNIALRQVVFALTALVLITSSSCGRREEKGKDSGVKKISVKIPVKAPADSQPAAGHGISGSTKKDAGDSENIAGFKSIVDAYYGEDPQKELPEKANEAIKGYNEWASGCTKAINNEQERLSREGKGIDELGGKITELDSQLKVEKKDSMNSEEVEAYNKKILQANALSSKQKELYEPYKKAADKLKAAIADFDKEQQKRSKQIDDMKLIVDKRMQEYADWHSSDKGLALFQSVNELYAKLARECRGREINSDMRTLQTIRKQLGEFTKKHEDSRENGLIIVPAKLVDSEDAYFIVDTGATVTTISPAIVRVLGLEDKLGPEVSVTLAAGIKIKGPELVLTQVTVFGKTAGEVKAVVIEPSIPGVDGLLGHSFLDQFDYVIDRTTDPKLKLNPKSK